MADNSLESLLEWMKDVSRMLGWDMIIALDGQRINHDLQQDYVMRLSQGNDLSYIDVSIDIPETNITQYLTGVKLGAPRLSFENASLQSTTTSLNMAVLGGNLVMVETVAGQKHIRRLSRLDPLDGSELQLTQPFDVDTRNVQVDLAKGEDALLTLFQTPLQQREAGKAFLEQFKALDEKKRINTLATFPEVANPFMLSRSIDVRTQKRDVTSLAPRAVNEEGTLLLFTGMADGRKGDFPGDNAGFKNLIPDADGQKTWSATMLLSQALIHRAAFGDAVLKLLEDAHFERVSDGAGALTKLVAQSGTLQAPAARYRSLVYEFESEPFSISATDGALPLTVEFGEDQAIQRWQPTVKLSFRYRPINGSTWLHRVATFQARLEHEFHFSAAADSVLGMEGNLFVPYENKQEISHESGLPETDPAILEQLNEFVAQTVKRGILEKFSNTLTAHSSDALLAGFTVVGQSTLQPTDAALPCDQVLFGQLHSSTSSFSVIPLQSLVAAGKTLQFGTEPARTGLTWAVENLSGSVSNPGSINEDGLYKAPPGHTIEGSFNRVLVIATDSDANERSAALLTVQSSPITVNPQIQTCFPGEQVELTAGNMGTNNLSWSISNPVPGESGTVVVSDLPGGDHAYKAAPQVADKTYVLDEIEVTDELANETRSCRVLVIQHQPGAKIKPVDSPPQPEGQIQLQASVNGISKPGKWSLPSGGPGSIDQSGLYLDDPAAKDDYVLIMVEVDGGDLGKFDGHIILPLPLQSFPAVLKALAE